MKAYHDIIRHVLETGTRKENRTGVDTLSTFHHSYELDMADGFPLLTTKEISWKNIVIETLWFLSGSTNVSFLRKHGCKFWDAWADGSGNVPSAYGNFWREFPAHDEFDYVTWNDQIAWVVDELQRNPMSRRMVVSAWAPGNAQKSKLPPCHMQFVLNVQNPGPRLNLHMTQRSCDVALGVPYNIASYALLLHLFARFSGLEPGIFAHTLVDAHIYTCKPDGSMAEFDHVPGLKEQICRTPRGLPVLEIGPGIQTLEDVESLIKQDFSTEDIMKRFRVHGYNPHPAIPFKVAV